MVCCCPHRRTAYAGVLYLKPAPALVIAFWVLFIAAYVLSRAHCSRVWRPLLSGSWVDVLAVELLSRTQPTMGSRVTIPRLFQS